MDDTPAASNDPVLVSFLLAQDDAEAARLLEELLRGEIAQTVRTAIRAALGPHYSREDADDLASEVMLRLVQRLRALRAATSAEPIEDFTAYAATVAAHASYRHLRSFHPAWTRLKNQIRYIVTHDPDLRLERPEGDLQLCRLVPPAVDRPTAPNAVRRVARERLDSVARRYAREVNVQEMPLRRLVKTLLGRCDAAVELNELVGAVAGLLEVDDSRLSPLDSRAREPSEIDVERLSGPTSEAERHLDHARFLRRLWEEICRLPARQRAALLLNLRDEQGAGILAFFPLTGAASMRNIAEALGMAAQEFARLWQELPLDDLRIAQRLGISRQQVINLRKAARERLARRLAEWRAVL